MERDTINETVMHNGQCVMTALVQNGATSQKDLLANFAECTDEPIDQIKHELKHVLTNGIAGGFILKKGNKYAIPGSESAYETDADKSCEKEGSEEEESEEEESEEEESEETPSKCVSVNLDGVGIKISVSGASGKRKAEDEPCDPCSSHASKKKRMDEDDDDGEDFHGFDDCK